MKISSLAQINPTSLDQIIPWEIEIWSQSLTMTDDQAKAANKISIDFRHFIDIQ